MLKSRIISDSVAQKDGLRSLRQRPLVIVPAPPAHNSMQKLSCANEICWNCANHMNQV